MFGTCIVHLDQVLPKIILFCYLGHVGLNAEKKLLRQNLIKTQNTQKYLFQDILPPFFVVAFLHNQGIYPVAAD